MPDTRSSVLPLLPLTEGVLFPGMVITLSAESDEARSALDAATGEHGDNRLLLVPKVDGRFSSVGTIALIETMGDLANGGRAIIARGLERARIGAGVAGPTAALYVEVDSVVEGSGGDQAQKWSREFRAVAEEVLRNRGGRRAAGALVGITGPGALADTIGYWPEAPQDRKVAVLETVDVEQRIRIALDFGRSVLAEIELRDRIRNDVAEGMEKTQRDFLLRQQLEAIKRELGEGDEEIDAVAEYRRRMAEPGVPAKVRAAVDKELQKLERTNAQAPEQGWIRNWLDTVSGLPWGVRSADDFDLERARAVLDADHTGLDEAKERVIEMLAVRKLRHERAARADAAALTDETTSSELGPTANAGTDDEPEARGSGADGAMLALVGPPGVGKTSLGASIARALGRPFVRIALGGMRDEADIRGHRRTYVGAAPGRLVRAIADAGTMNPVVLLDEIDKVGSDGRGDPSSALLEVLDPAQNHTFADHYLEVELDLSDVLFLATANVLDAIPPALLDRIEVLRLDGYTEDEKVAIAASHLAPRQRDRHGLEDGDVQITASALHAIVNGYTREPGVRQLERQVAKVLRKAATFVASGTQTTPVIVDDADVLPYLGRPRFVDEPAARTSVAGVATGLAVTGMGGDVLFIEATTVPHDDVRDPLLRITGQLGDVMRESAEIALSYVRSNARTLGIAPEALRGNDIHLHVPAGAVPKDGPSAGVTMTTALVSLLTGHAVRREVAMTGEVTLRGSVLPIGGLKQKLLAAHRAGLTDVIVPRRNEADLDDVPPNVRDALRVHLVDEVREVLSVALVEEHSETRVA